MSLPQRPSGAVPTIAVGLACLALAIAQVASQYAPRTWINRDGRFYTNVNVTLVESLSLEQNEFCASWYQGRLGWNHNLDRGWSNVAMGPSGEHLPKHPIWMPILSTPFFWALGLDGNLVFNLLMFALAGAFAFAVLRRYASEPAAAVAALSLMLATSIRGYAYDYHVDILNLALFFAGWAALHTKKGVLAGVLLGIMVALRPTALMWMPALAMTCVMERDRRSFLGALGGGTVILLAVAAVNWGLYGRPWWTGYQRILVVVNGQPEVADMGDAFAIPFDVGIRELWGGGFGVARNLTLMVFAIPGMLVLLRRRARETVVFLLTIAGAVLIFAKYRWFGDRFLWPAAGLLLPGLAVTTDLVGSGLRPQHRPWAVAAAIAGFCILANILAGAPFEERFAGVTFGSLALNVSLLALTCGALARIARDRAPGPLAVIAPAALLFTPGVVDRALNGGPDLWVAGLMALALAMKRWWIALPLAIAAGYFALGPKTTDLVLLSESLKSGDGRGVLVLMVLAACGLPFTGWYSLRLLPLLALMWASVSSLGGGRWPLFVIVLLTIPIAALAARLAATARDLARTSTRKDRWVAIASIALLLGMTGVVRRVLADDNWRIASYRSVRHAHVTLGDVPCDFLAWEHLNWECATFDGGVHGETGLSTSAPLRVGGVVAPLFLITTRSGRPRTVEWTDVPSTGAFWIDFAVPEEMRGGGRLLLKIGDHTMETFELPATPSQRLSHRRFDTRFAAGRPVTVRLELSGSMVGVLVDGGFERAP